MFKLFLICFLTLGASAESINSVVAIVGVEPITKYDVKEEMQKTGENATNALDGLIRKKLEIQELQKRKIEVTQEEIFDEIKQLALNNKVSVDQFYEIVRQNSGLSSSEFKEKTKERLLAQKLYSEISYSSMNQPSDEEIAEYVELHKEALSKPLYFDVIIYSSSNDQSLEKIIKNPMFNSGDITKNEQKLFYEKISPDLAKLLESTAVGKFTPIVSVDNLLTTFYIKNISSNTDAMDSEAQKFRIINQIMGQKREQVLSDYFAKLKNNSDVKILDK